MRSVQVILLLLVVAGCVNNENPAISAPRILHEAVKLPSEYHPSIFGMAYDEEEYTDLLNPAHDYAYYLSQYFGVTYDKHYSNIYGGLKPLRIALLSYGKNFIFEVQMDGDVEIAKKYYGKRMQILITFMSPPRALRDYRIITTGSLDKALLLSGDLGGLEILIDDNRKAVSAKLHSKFKIEKELKLELKGDRARIYVPVESLPREARKSWSAEKADFEWDVIIGLALEPLDPIPTNLTDVFFMPEVYHIWYPLGRSTLSDTLKWSVKKAPIPTPEDEKREGSED